MRPWYEIGSGKRLTVVALGAHSDDIEIGAGGTILDLCTRGVDLDIHWCVLSAVGRREEEARASAADFLEGAAARHINCADFRDGYFPYDPLLKDWFEGLKAKCPTPDIVLTHRHDDAHQDHRELSRLAWNTFRDATILEYEIPKWDGDLCQPNAYVALAAPTMERKITLLMKHFGTQRSKDWFDAETFRGLARLRGMECRAPGRYAEAFVARKLRLL